ncbi:MAG: glycosyl hydrolase family 79 C-terminal domain-containing protein [Solirubrobacteraceae bacterium]
MSGNGTSSRAALAVLAAAAIALVAPHCAAALTVERATVGNPVPSGFVGLSMEYRGLAAYAGANPRAVDPAFVQLIRDIAPNQRPVLRIGGDSTDWTWYPVAHTRRPPGIRYDLSPNWIGVTRTLARTLDARLIMGLNLEADSRTVAAAEARAFVSGIGRSTIDALEIGNEPELYGSFSWYRTPSGQHVTGRPAGYGFPGFVRDFSSFARSLPEIALAGPSSGSSPFLAQLGTFLRDEPRVRLATLHEYPLKHCVRSTVVTIGQLLSDASSHGLADTVAPLVAVAHSHRVQARVDEMNAVTCGGTSGVSDTFASALWALDTLFEMARVGVDGVNIHTVPNTINELLGPSFTKDGWEVRVHPQYYGLIMFAQAAPPGSELLRIAGTPAVGVKVWATRAPDGHIRVVLINKHLRRAEVLRLQVQSASGPASVEQLRAPSIQSKTGVTLGGQSFGPQTATGLLAGRPQVTLLAPSGNAYVVRVPGASATMLTLSAQ